MQIIPIHITDQQGITHIVEGLVGWRLMEVIRDYGLPIKAECGGACCCATCHIYVHGLQYEHLPAPFPEEIAMLDEAFDVQPTSRLSCQIILDETMSGLQVTLAAGSEP